jgi:hypothetical protein
MDTGECQPLYHSIRDYYEGMNMKLDQQIPMLLVEQQALNEAMEGESKVSISSVFFLQNVQPLETLTFITSALSRAHTTCLKQGAYAYRRSRL